MHSYADGKDNILPRFAVELVLLQLDVILAIGTTAARAAKLATQTIPVVFARVADPIGLGLVPSLARPGGNLTGMSVETPDLAAKWLEFLITAVPDAKRLGVLLDPGFPPSGSLLKEIEGAARFLNLQLVPTEVRGLAPRVVQQLHDPIQRREADLCCAPSEQFLHGLDTWEIVGLEPESGTMAAKEGTIAASWL